MATEDDLEKDEKKAAGEDADDKAEVRSELDDDEKAIAEREAVAAGKADDAAREAAATPMQLGYVRFVYAAYMAGAMLVGFLIAKASHVGWYRLGQWKPEFGEPRDEIVYVVSGLLGVGVALYYWRKPEARQYANEVAEELSKVTWPSRKEVTNSTTVVLFYTLFATVFFALMDQFWKYVTDKIYSF